LPVALNEPAREQDEGDVRSRRSDHAAAGHANDSAGNLVALGGRPPANSQRGTHRRRTAGGEPAEETAALVEATGDGIETGLPANRTLHGTLPFVPTLCWSDRQPSAYGDRSRCQPIRIEGQLTGRWESR
jgi:hypothetical protein